MTAFSARELHYLRSFFGAGEIASDFPGLRKQFRIVDGDFVIDRVRIGNRETFNGVQGVAQIWYFPGVRRLAEIRGVDDQSVSLPVAYRVSHEEADVFSQMGTAIQMDDPCVVVVLRQNHH